MIRDDCTAGVIVHVCYLTHCSVYGADAAQRAAESRQEQGIFDGELAEKAGLALDAVTARYPG